MEITKKIESLETHHQLRTFILIVGITIILTRLIVLIKDPEIIIYNYTLHHFYYGVILLVLVCILILFSEKHKSLFLNISAIAIGLIIDEFLFVLGKSNGTEEYLKTLPSVIVFFLLITIISLAIYYSKSRKNKK